MQNIPNHSPLIWRICALLILGLIATYPTARLLPVQFGWENGFFENAQFIVLVFSGLCALWWAIKAPTSAMRWFWLMIAPIWFILALRELSWGAALMTPLSLNPHTGPVFSSSQQLAHKSWITGSAALALLFSGVVFFATKQWRTLKTLYQQRSFPIFEILLAILATAYSASAEGHISLDIYHGWSHASMQVLEEFTELFAYLFVALAQWRVYKTLQSPHLLA